METQGIDGYIPHPALQGNIGKCSYNEKTDTYKDTE
jgi:hypothetical protein